MKYFNKKILSFTYGDTFPAMRYNDGKKYRRKVYTLDELPGIIKKFGLPQKWNKGGNKYREATNNESS